MVPERADRALSRDTGRPEDGSAAPDAPLLSVRNLKLYFPITRGLTQRKVGDLKAVDDVSFDIGRGKTFGLVGESGCGKTSVGKCILQIHKPVAGSILYKGTDLASANKRALRLYRRELQLIFQDPYGSLDPRQSVGSILSEAIEADGARHTASGTRERAEELLDIVELGSSMARRYPHELSGGQRQRLGIARALACNPELIVCDEPVSALDVSIQAQIINLFKSIQRRLNVTYLFIAHDLAVVRHVSDVIGVMYLGRLVEVTTARDLYTNPLHPYTKALLSAVPITDYYLEQKRARIVLQGDVPSPINAPSGCAFHPRCPIATQQCRVEAPRLRPIEGAHHLACHNV
jgi:peptide/nickel transport system ATP-binding protein